MEDILRLLFAEGRLVVASPLPVEAGNEPALAVLRGAFDRYRFEVAGPLIAFDAATALGAARFLLNAAWFLGNFEETEAALQ